MCKVDVLKILFVTSYWHQYCVRGDAKPCSINRSYWLLTERQVQFEYMSTISSLI